MPDTPRPTYKGWLEAREHPWDCGCVLCRVNLDQIDPETLGKFKARFREVSSEQEHPRSERSKGQQDAPSQNADYVSLPAGYGFSGSGDTREGHWPLVTKNPLTDRLVSEGKRRGTNAGEVLTSIVVEWADRHNAGNNTKPEREWRVIA